MPNLNRRQSQRIKVVKASGLEKLTQGTLFSASKKLERLFRDSDWSEHALTEFLLAYDSTQVQHHKRNLESENPCSSDYKCNRSLQSMQLLERQVHVRTATITPASSKCTNAPMLRLKHSPELRKHDAVACTEELVELRTFWFCSTPATRAIQQSKLIDQASIYV